MPSMNLGDYVANHGDTKKLALAIGVNPVLVSQWANDIRPVPLERCVDIEKATNGKVRCEELRPDMLDYFRHLRRCPKAA